MLEYQPNRTQEPVNSLEPQQIRLLAGIRDYLDANKGYFFPLVGMAILLEADDKIVAGYLRALLNSGFIKEAPSYRGAFDITEKGRSYLLTTQLTDDPLKSAEIENQGWWDRFSGWFVVNILLRFYKYEE